MIDWLIISWLGLTCLLATLAQYYKVRAEALAEEVLNAHDWVDQIIEALESPEGDASDERIAGLVGSRTPDGAPVVREHRGIRG